MKKLLAILMISCMLTAVVHANFVIRPELSVSHTLIDPGESTTLTAVFYTDQIEKHIAELRVPQGFTVNVAQQDVFTDGANGQLHNWVITANPKMHYGRYAFELWIDGVFVDTISIDVRLLGTWVYLPIVTKSTN